MIDVYILDGNLNQIGIIDTYVSLLWVNRYASEGDCELYVEATNENLSLLKRVITYPDLMMKWFVELKNRT